MRQHPIDAAILYAVKASGANERHEGLAWHLKIHLLDGKTIEVAVSTPSGRHPGPCPEANFEHGRDGENHEAGDRVFLNYDAVTHVDVVWM